MEQVRLTVVNSPFNLWDKTDYYSEYEAATPVSEYIAAQNFLTRQEEGIDLSYSINGRVLTEEDLNHICPNPGDQIIILPVLHGGGGDDKSIIRVLAMVVVMVLAVVTQQYWAAGLGKLGAALAGAAVATAGSLLVNWLLPVGMPSTPKLDSGVGGDFDSTDTYGWGEMRNITTQGGAIPRIYGTRRVAGVIINRYIDVQENDEYYNALIAVHDGNVQAIKKIQINGQDISNYSHVWVRCTYGTRQQPQIPYFDDTYDITSYNTEITDSTYVTKTTSGDSVEGLRIEVVCPYGLYYANDSGGLSSTYVEISIEYSVSGAASWTALTGGQDREISASDSTYTNWGFKFTSTCDRIRFFFGQNTSGHFPLYSSSHNYATGQIRYQYHPLRYRTGYHATMDTGWVEMGSYKQSWVEIRGLNHAQIVEVAVAADYDTWSIGDIDDWFSSITRYYKAGNINIIGAQNKPIRRAFEVHGLSPAQYDVRIKVTDTEASTSRYINTIYLKAIGEIIPDDLTYPYTALLGVRALATAQLSSGAPSITCEVVRSHTIVYNTNTSQWEAVRADNPAWACYDILVKPFYELTTGGSTGDTVTSFSYKGRDGIDPTTRIDYDAFKNWADYCDELTDEGDKRCVVDIVFDSQTPTWEALSHISQVGRGMVVMRGTKFSCVIDKSYDPVQLFTVGNIYEDSFKESFLGLEDRANVIEVTYFDETRDYQRESIQVYGNDYSEGDLERRSTITLYGCTSYNRAFREALYRLNCNKYLTRSVSFDVDVDALACQVGDVIRVQHDIPQWGFGGRVVSASSDSVVLDRTITLAGGSTYVIYIRHSGTDTVESQTITTGAGDHSTLSIAPTNWSTTPSEHDVYAVGVQNSEFKKLKIVEISRSGDLKRTISAIEYNESLYEEGTPIDWDVSALQTIPIAANVSALERLRTDTGGNLKSEVHVIWTYSEYTERKIAKWLIYRKNTSITDSVWEYLGATTSNIYVSNQVEWQINTSYTIAVCGYDALSNRAHNPDNPEVGTDNLTILWKTAPPEDVSNFIVAQDGSSIIFKWDHVTDADRRGYLIREGASWETGTNITKEISQNLHIHTAPYTGNWTYWIKAIDTSGNMSVNATSADVNIDIGTYVNIVYSIQEIDDFVDGIASDLSLHGNITDNLVWIHSGNTPGLAVPHALLDTGSGVSTWVDSGTSLTYYDGSVVTAGYYQSPCRDVGAEQRQTLRLVRQYHSEVLRATDLTYPNRTDISFPNDTDAEITSLSAITTMYRYGSSSPLASASWVTYTSTPIEASFRYFQRKELFTLDTNLTTLNFVSIASYVDVPDKLRLFNAKSISGIIGAESGTTFNLSSDLSLNFLVDYTVVCTTVTDAYYYSFKNKSLSDFHITLYDDAGNIVPGEVNMVIKGY